MAEWLFEAGIGEARAALVEGDRIVEAHIEADTAGLPVGSVIDVRLVERQGRRGIVRMRGVELQGLIDPIDPLLTIGRTVRATVVREAIAEPGALKRMKLRVTPDAALQRGPNLAARIAATGLVVHTLAPHEPDALEAAGWSEALEAAGSGLMPFAGGQLRISLTPAMTLIDVDGDLAPLALALAGARAAAAAIRCFDLAGSIGIDLPTVGGKVERLAVAAEVDAILPQPFERTAVNGFGFLQIVRPRLRASLCEHLRADAPAAAARALLRRAQRSGRIGAVTLVVPPPVVAVLDDRPEWLEMLGRQLGGSIALRADAGLAMDGGHVAPSL